MLLKKNLSPRNFYLGKADYIFTLTFAAEVCLKVPTTNSPLQQLNLCEVEHYLRLSFMCWLSNTLRRWSLCLRWCVSLHQSILPILAPVTCYTPSPRNNYLTWNIFTIIWPGIFVKLFGQLPICPNFWVQQDYISDSLKSMSYFLITKLDF